jgi:hypothetical protein
MITNNTQMTTTPAKLSPENFCYWLQGLFELTDTVALTEKQVKQIKDHLGYVFNTVHVPTTVTIATPPASPYLPGYGGPTSGTTTISCGNILDSGTLPFISTVC